MVPKIFGHMCVCVCGGGCVVVLCVCVCVCRYLCIETRVPSDCNNCRYRSMGRNVSSQLAE